MDEAEPPPIENVLEILDQIEQAIDDIADDVASDDEPVLSEES